MYHTQKTTNDCLYKQLLECSYHEIELFSEDKRFKDFINKYRHHFSKLEMKSVEVTTEDNKEFVVVIKGIKTDKMINFEKFSVNMSTNLKLCLNGMVPEYLICDLKVLNQLDHDWLKQRKKICVRNVGIRILSFVSIWHNTTHLEMELTEQRTDLCKFWRHFQNLVHLTIIESGDSIFTYKNMVHMTTGLSELNNFQYLELRFGNGSDICVKGICVVMQYFKCINGASFKFSNVKKGNEKKFSKKLNNLSPSIVSHEKHGEVYTITRSDGINIFCTLKFA